jgi:uncharacterized protein YdaU (DUF1376 family)
MKDLPYITHDFGARNDPKLMDLQMDMGGQGLGIYWCLVEMLWENGGSIPANYKSIAFALRWCKPAEVEKVVTGYRLFEVKDGCLFSQSATARINEMRSRFGARSESSRKANAARWGKQPQSERSANGMRTESERSANGIPLTNILTNKQTNSINNTPLTAADFFEIFFFDNVKDPLGEAQRFLDHYNMTLWTYADGTPVTDNERAAHDWKPLKSGKRWDEEALRWYRAVWNAAINRSPEPDATKDTFLCQLTNMRRKDQQLALIFRTPGAAMRVSSFIRDNDLAGDYKLDFRIEN